MPTTNAEAQVKELNASLKQIGDQIKANAEQTHKEIQRTGEMQAETRAKVDELLTKQGELQARLHEAEQKLIGAHLNSAPSEPPKSAGQRVIEHESLQNRNSGSRFSARVSMPRAAITSIGDGGARITPSERLDQIVGGTFRRMTIRDLLAPGSTGAAAIEYVRESGFTNTAAPVAENTAATYSDLTLELKIANVRTIAHLFKASRLVLDDLSALQSYIDARAAYGLMLAEEAQLLHGSGSGANLEGLMTVAQAYAAPTGATVVDEQHIDRLRLALLQAELAEFPSDGIVLHPTDWATIELIKDTNGQYIIGKPQDGTTPRLWNRPVVATQAINQNDFLVGAFQLGAQIFDRSTAEVIVSTENDTDFEKGMVTIRAEERLGFAIYRDEAFVKGNLIVTP